MNSEGKSMNYDELISYVSKQLCNNRNLVFDDKIYGTEYKIMFLAPDADNDINIPSILAIPKTRNFNNQIILEANNLENGNLEKVVEQASHTSIRLMQTTKNFPCPIVVPIIPSYKDYPYLQQLSRECFDIPSSDKNYRIDNQVVTIINKAKEIVKTEKGIDVKDKIFLNGYSSSACFAQRFALLHPDIIEIACLGGASGSIPVPTKDFDYPIGVADFQQLTGKAFDFDSYSKIRFRYYVGEFETERKSDNRFDDFGSPAPMHDMSYFDRSVPNVVGKKQRSVLGTKLFNRANNSVCINQNLGIDISHEIILGREHSNINGNGVCELGDKFVRETYKSTIASKIKDNDMVK